MLFFLRLLTARFFWIVATAGFQVCPFWSCAFAVGATAKKPPSRAGELFFVSFAHESSHNRRVIGPFLNALGILAGALCGLAMRQPISRRAQEFFKSALGVFTVFYGLRLVYESVHGTAFACLKQLAVAFVGVVLGNWLGRLLRLQKISNRVGHHAATLLADAQKNPPGAPAAGFVAATVLFCAAPLGFLGAVADGLSQYFYLLLVKAVMDGLAMLSFVKLFRWPVALAALPVFLFLNSLALSVQYGLAPWLAAHLVGHYVNLAAGLVTCSVSLVIFEVRRVELANYLPALAVAPLLAYLAGMN
jgi:uncharacterized membrane protein YqgA involved in biofilm formation